MWDRPRPPASAAILLEVGVERGVSETVMLGGTSLTRAGLADPKTVVSGEQELRIIRNLLRACPDDDALGLDVGRRFHLTTHGIWGFALASSRSGWDALTVGLRFVALTWAFCEIKAVTTDTEVRLHLDAAAVPEDLRDFLTQREMASIVTIAREVSGLPIHPAAAHLRQAAPRDARCFTDFLNAPAVFGADADYVPIPRALLDAPLPQADAHTAALTVEQCQQLLDRWQSRSGIAGQVRELLLQRPDDMPGIDDIAAAMHMSARTLRRRLDDESTSFRALVDDVRERLAEELLTTAALSVEQIARRLGYSATPAFTAAFTRWKGMSPRAYAASSGSRPAGVARIGE